MDKFIPSREFRWRGRVGCFSQGLASFCLQVKKSLFALKQSPPMYLLFRKCRTRQHPSFAAAHRMLRA